jgi:phytoene dehydrogenase-like protein
VSKPTRTSSATGTSSGRGGTDRADVVVVGGGHNGLTAAAYLAAAGKSVVVLERLDGFGGAAVSAPAFPGVDARLSRYSYLVSLLPQVIIRDLKLDIRLARRRYSSYTPLPGTDTGLLVDTGDAAATAASFAAIGAIPDAAAWQRFYAGTERVARALFPAVTEPLATRSETRRMLGDDAEGRSLWDDLIENPVGTAIQREFADDLVRGVVLTDALIGTFAPNVDETLAGNRCFLYHVIGGGTGDWDVPVGGMGAVSGALWRAAVDAGAKLVNGAEVTAITPDGEISYRTGGDRGTEHRIAATTVLANIAPFELSRLLGAHGSPVDRPEGAQVKVNLLLKRLPRLRDANLDPVAAFGGTFHANEGWRALSDAYAVAAGSESAGAGSAPAVPDPLPVEIYCHSLTDPSILSPELRASGAQTLTVFGLHVPDRLLTEGNNDARRAELEAAVFRSLDAVLGEPLADVLLTDGEGRPCVETKTTLDIEHALRMPGGNIFHGPLSWPFAEDDAELGTPALRWGVATEHERILLCGSGAQRGGAVSGLGGHNAAMAVLEADH